MLKPKHVIGLFVSLCSVIVASLSFTLAWFASNKEDFDGNISGSVLDAYFDFQTGADTSKTHGSQTNPFVIYNINHYENMVKLYTQTLLNANNQPYVFANTYFYFEIGKKGSDGKYYVKDYDNFGADLGTTSQVLNMKSIQPFEPMGNDSYPFNASVDGHGITIKNFTVNAGANASQNYTDIGIFGLVNMKTRCKDIYWSDFTIEAKGAKAVNHTQSNIEKHNGNVRIGYIAGHIKTYESFTDCYVNNCKINADTISYNYKDDYGYFGMVEIDKIGSALPGGKNYAFTFDTEVWYQYFRDNYSTIQGLPATVRTSPTASGTAVPNAKVSNTILKGDILSSYYVAGNKLSASADRSYGLSNTGYTGGPTTVTKVLYDAYYQDKDDDDNEYKAIPTTATKSAYNDACNMIPEDQGKYHYCWDPYTNSWKYYYCNNTIVDPSSTLELKIVFNHTTEYCGGLTNNKPSDFSSKFYLYLDDDKWGSPSYTWSGTGKADGNWAARYCYWDCADQTLTLPLGTHVGCLVWHRQFKWNGTSYSYYGVSGIGSKTLAQPEFNKVTLSAPSISGTTCTITYNNTLSISTTNCCNNGNTPTLNDETDKPFIPSNAFAGSDNKSYNICYRDSVNSSYVRMKNAEDGSVTYNDSDVYLDTTSNKVVASIPTVTIDSSQATNRFYADEEVIKKSGYNPKCIDIVGGGVGFYYYSSGDNSIRILRVESEGKTAANTVVKKITSTDISNKAKFLATERCNQSIVLYIKNVGLANDSIDDNLGTIKELAYYQLSSSIFSSSTVHPSFKRGATSSEVDYIDLSTLIGNATQDGLRMRYKNITLKESVVKKAAYCCLDANGCIIGQYNADGSRGSLMSAENEAKIDTYVLVIGAFTNADYANWQLWLNKIDFECKAADGEGGSFGTVGYRSAGQDKITNTILNFVFNKASSSGTFSVLVLYTQYSSGTKKGKYEITVAYTTSLTITVYNYYSTLYDVYVNKTQMSGYSSAYTYT